VIAKEIWNLPMCVYRASSDARAWTGRYKNAGPVFWPRTVYLDWIVTPPLAAKTTEEYGIRKIKDRKLSIGLDLGNRSGFYCGLDESGDVILERKVSTTAKALAEALAEMP
jgi:hypothetical protein